jgi:hypothetical protein
VLVIISLELKDCPLKAYLSVDRSKSHVFVVAFTQFTNVYCKKKVGQILTFNVLSFGCFPGVWFILADVSEHSICSIFKADDLEVM